MPLLPVELEHLILTYAPARDVTPAILKSVIARRQVPHMPVSCALCGQLPSVFCFLSYTPLTWLDMLPVALACRSCAVRAPVYTWDGERGLYIRATPGEVFDASPGQILNVPNLGFLMPVLY